MSKKQIYWLFKALLIALLVDNFSVINYFLENKNVARSSKLLSNLSHNYSNINILSASLVLKVPFALFFIVNETKRFWKFLALFTVASTFSVTLFISARTGFYNLLIISGLFLLYILLFRRRKELLTYCGVLLVFIGVSIFFTLNINKVNRYKLNRIEQMFSPDFRVKIDNTSQKSVFTNLSGREIYWRNAINTFKNYPLLGVGLGNWKLSSKDSMITKNRSISFLPYRAHNDFLEMAAELGVFGLFLFTSIFVLLFYFCINSFLDKEVVHKKDMFFCLLLALVVFLSDSIFNFPFERPSVFILFVLTSGLILFNNPQSQPLEKKRIRKPIVINIVFLAILSIVVFTLFFNWKLFSSSMYEKKIYYSVKNKSYEDLTKNKTYTYQNLVDKINTLPNQLGADGQSLEMYKAIFARAEKRYKQSIEHYKNAIVQMPSNKLPVRGLIEVYYHNLKNKDSALFYSKDQFNNYPFDKGNYLILRGLYKEGKDTVEVMNTMNRFLKHSPNEVKTWMSKAYNHYVYFKNKKRVDEIIDSAITINPESKKELEDYKKGLVKE
ncbi:O-antigen ligase family protein [Tenacibaculum xiamenense]|uniref:O-antigen ligase family protein n=1 Tax=Tenacibaculum xiamenense TaxID=1261553 RepID=UPI0038B5C4EC